MKINKHTGLVETMTKEKFNELTDSEKQIAVAKDVLYRINIKQLLPKKSLFCGFNNGVIIDGEQLSTVLKRPNLQCTVCAKGGLFLSYIGIVNDYKLKDSRIHNGEANTSKEMDLLSDVFSKKQLTLIETSFEGRLYPWNESLTEKEENKCLAFYGKYKDTAHEGKLDNTVVLIAICKNIIKNKGEFKP